MNERGDTATPPRAVTSRHVCCSVCGESGHNKGTCKQRQAEVDDEKRSLTCNNCKEVGHNKRTCDRRHSTGNDAPKKSPSCPACGGDGRIVKGGKVTKCTCKAGQKAMVGSPGAFTLTSPAPQHLYGECQRQIPYPNGALSVDGCQLFEAEAEEGPGERKCAACGCHRNFHRVIVPQAPSSVAPSPSKKLKTSGAPSSSMAPMTTSSLAIMSTPLQLQQAPPPPQHVMMLPPMGAGGIPGMSGGDDPPPSLPPPQSLGESAAMMSLASMGTSGGMGDGHGSSSGFVGIMDRGGQVHPMGGMHAMPHAHQHQQGMGPPGTVMTHPAFMAPPGAVMMGMMPPMAHMGPVSHVQPRPAPSGALNTAGPSPAQSHGSTGPTAGAPAPSSASAPGASVAAPAPSSSPASLGSGVAAGTGAGVDNATAGAAAGSAATTADETGAPTRVDASAPSDGTQGVAQKVGAGESPAPSSSPQAQARSSPGAAAVVPVGLASAAMVGSAVPGSVAGASGGSSASAPITNGSTGGAKRDGGIGAASAAVVTPRR